MERAVLPAKAEHLETMLQFIRDGAEKYGLDGRTVRQVMVAVEEPLMNVISYAYPGGEGDVEITHCVEPGRGFVVRIADRGVAFDPLSLPEPDVEAPLEERQVGGLGIYMMRKIMDQVRYQREQDRNVLTLVKR